MGTCTECFAVAGAVIRAVVLRWDRDATPSLFQEKYCLPQMEERVQNGTLQPRPTSLKFFLKASTGKEIVEYAVDKLKSESGAASTKKTDRRLAP